jgi:hypothetical protein
MAQHYQWFCDNFMESVTVIPASAAWKLKLRKQKLSKYATTTTLEACVVLVYYNSFDVWSQYWRVESSASTNCSEDGIDDVSTIYGE